jgi:hypothetical protein
VKAGDVKELIRNSIKDPQGSVPMFLWGGPGIGKSTVVRDAASEEGVGCIDIRLVLMDPSDLRGIPVPDDGKAKWLPPSFLPSGDWQGVIFLDELNVAPPLVQNTALQLVLDRRVGEYELPSGAVIIAAGNREMEAFVHRMSPPLLNRFIHISFGDDPFPGGDDINEWLKWAVRNDIDPMVIAFLTKFKPELLYQFDTKKKAYPTPRSWSYVSKILKNGTSEELKFELIKGCVGEGATIELKAYVNIWSELPDLDKILYAGDNTIPTSVDLIYACCIGLVSKANTSAQYNRLLEYALMLDREFTIFMLKMLYQKDKDKVIATDGWSEIAKTLVVDEEILS